MLIFNVNIELFKLFYEIWIKSGCKFLPVTNVSIKIFSDLYRIGCNYDLTPLEKLEQDEKIDLWIESGKNINLCKILYLLKKFYKKDLVFSKVNPEGNLIYYK